VATILNKNLNGKGGETEMWRSKKFIIIAVLAAVVLVGSIGGVAIATDNGDDGQPQAQYGALLERVCEIYEQKTGVAIDQETLKDAFAQAQSEMRTEALESWLQSLVDEDKITQEQADQYLEWWQARPDMPIKFGFGGRGGFRGMGGMRGFGGPCVPKE
jgi:hypothetical protein